MKKQVECRKSQSDRRRSGDRKETYSLISSVDVRGDRSVQVTPRNSNSNRDRSFVRSFSITRKDGDGVGNEGEDSSRCQIDREVGEGGVAAEDENEVSGSTDEKESHCE